MIDSIKQKDLAACQLHMLPGENDVDPPDAPLVVFVNSSSGGRYGPELKQRLQQVMGPEQGFDLSDVKPNEFVEETREKIRVVVAGGDGTVGWVLGSLGELNKQGREPVPPVGIIPLGTGNDLARSFGWGGTFPFAWKSAVKKTLNRAGTGPICHLDSWHITMQVQSSEVVDPPYSLKPAGECALDQGLTIEGELPEKVNSYEGVFYNYFSVGMDAQVAYGFHHLRNENLTLHKVLLQIS
ncbi:hypothetical protein ACOSQ3_012897 [Xanthoceras sorbifolium]